MSKNVPEPELFESVDFHQPTISKKTHVTATAKVKRRSKTPSSALPESLQPFLPGLSRRGRPRAKHPIPASVRASESRKRRLAAGMKRIELLLTPETAAALERLCHHHHLPRSEIISRLILKAAKRLPPA